MGPPSQIWTPQLTFLLSILCIILSVVKCGDYNIELNLIF